MSADLLQTGLAWLAERMKDQVSTSVTYTRGSKSVTLRATIGESLFTVDEIEGQRRSFTSVHFDIQSADLVWDSVTRTPERRDRITWGTRTFEVNTPAGERHWKWLSGLVGVRMRIFTKEV